MNDDLDTLTDIEALRLLARGLQGRVAHLEQHCEYMAKCFAAERLHEVEPKTDVEIEAHRALLRARIAHADEHHGNLAAAKARDVAALAALGPSAPQQSPPDPPPSAPAPRKARGGGGSGGDNPTRPAARRVQRKVA